MCVCCQDLSQRLAELEMEKKKVEVSLEQTSSETVSKLTEAVNVQQRLDEEKQVRRLKCQKMMIVIEKYV